MVNVDGFDKIEWITEQSNYTLDVAKKLLGYYIFPAEAYDTSPSLVTGTEKKDIEDIKDGFISWILRHDKDMEAIIDGFNEKEFEKRNRAALTRLLNMSINEYITGISDTPTKGSRVTVQLKSGPREPDEDISLLAIRRDKKFSHKGEIEGMPATDFLENLSDKVLDPNFFNIDIKLRDIFEQTAQSKYFYQLTPTQIKDPLVQRLFAELGEEEYRVADVGIPGKELLSIDNPGEFLQRYETVMRRNRPVDVRTIENGKEVIFEAMAGEIFDFTSEEMKKTIMDKLLEGYGNYNEEELTERELDTKIAIHFLAAVVNSRHSDETIIDMDFLYPFSLLPDYPDVLRVLEEFKKNSKRIKKLTEPTEEKDKEGNIIKLPAKIILEIPFGELEDLFDFSPYFDNEDDQDRYEEAVIHTERIIGYLEQRGIGHNLISGARVNRVIEKFLKDLSLKLSGQVYTLEFSTKSGRELEASQEDLGIRILSGDNPISLNRLKDVMKDEPVMKLTGTNVTDDDVKPFIKTRPRVVQTNLTRRTPIKFSIGPLDLSKASPLPAAARSNVEVLNAGIAENKISRLVKINKELKNYTNKKAAEEKEVTAEEKIYNKANEVMEMYLDIVGKLKTMSLVKSKDAKKVISRTNINKLVDLLTNIIDNYDSVQNKQVDNVGLPKLIDNIGAALDKDNLSWEDFRKNLGNLKEICEVVTSTLEPTVQVRQRKKVTEEEIEEQNEERKRLKLEEMAQEDDDEDSLEVATTQGADGETVEEEETDIEEISELNRNDYDFIMNELGTIDDNSLVSIINNIDDPEIEAQLDAYYGMIEEISKMERYEPNEISREAWSLSESIHSLRGLAGSLEDVKNSQRKFKQIKSDMRKLEETNENINSSTETLTKLLERYDLAEIILESIAEQSGFNTVNIVDLVVKYDLEFVEDIKNGAMFNKLRGKVNFEYKIIQVMEATTGKYDFPTVDAVGRKGSAKRMVNIADRARAKGSTKGQIQDERKAKIYSQIYNNLLELENIFREVEAE